MFPKPTIDNDIADLINKVNSAPLIDAAANVDANQEENGKASPPQDQAEGANDRNQGGKMMELTTNAKLIGGRVTVCCNIFEAIMKCVIEPLQLFTSKGLIMKKQNKSKQQSHCHNYPTRPSKSHKLSQANDLLKGQSFVDLSKKQPANQPLILRSISNHLKIN